MYLYRAVSQAEMDDILSSGQFRSNPDVLYLENGLP